MTILKINKLRIEDYLLFGYLIIVILFAAIQPFNHLTI